MLAKGHLTVGYILNLNKKDFKKIEDELRFEAGRPLGDPSARVFEVMEYINAKMQKNEVFLIVSQSGRKPTARPKGV